MWQVGLILVALLALWLFVRIGQRRVDNSKSPPLPKTALSDGFVPGLTSAWMPYAGTAAICALSAVGGVLMPEVPPFTGRWAGAHALLYELLGPYGWSGIFAMAALAFAIQARGKYEEGAAQRRKLKAP
jgi:hypothetical protein